MRNAILLQHEANAETRGGRGAPSKPNLSITDLPFQSPVRKLAPAGQRIRPQLVSTKELSGIWGVPESTLRYWRCSEIGPIYVKLGGRIKYDLADVERYVRANKRMPAVRAHGG